MESVGSGIMTCRCKFTNCNNICATLVLRTGEERQAVYTISPLGRGGQTEEAIRGTNGDGRRLDLDEHTIQYTDDVL